MNDQATSIETLFEKATDYSKTSLELIRLQAINSSALVVSSLASGFVLSIVVVFFITCLNIGLALWIGEMLGKTYYGFFVITGFYVLVAALVWAFRRPLIKEPVSHSIITKLLRQNTYESN